MKLLQEIYTGSEQPQAELTKRPSRKEIEAAWTDGVMYRGVSIWDQYYERNDQFVNKALERENQDVNNFHYQESYLGYSPKNDVFVAGYDTWGDNYDAYGSDEDEDDFQDGYDVDEITNVMVFKMVPNGDGELRITTVEPYHTPGTMFYGRGGSYDRLHSEYKDLIDIRLD